MPRRPNNPARLEGPTQPYNPSHNFEASPAGGDNRPTIEDEARPEYQVGYRKPPERYRFKPGQSGNPRGGKRGPRKPTTTQILEQMGAVFIEPVEARLGDKVVKLARIVAATHALLQKAMKADVPAMRVALSILEQLRDLPVPTGSQDDVEEAAAAKEIEAYLRHRIGNTGEGLEGQQ
jgi:hypothetical protein